MSYGLVSRDVAMKKILELICFRRPKNCPFKCHLR